VQPVVVAGTCHDPAGRVQEGPGRVVARAVVERARDHVDLLRARLVDVAARPGGAGVHLQHMGMRAGRAPPQRTSAGCRGRASRTGGRRWRRRCSPPGRGSLGSCLHGAVSGPRRDSVHKDTVGYFPAMHRVVALVRPVQSTFELGCAVRGLRHAASRGAAALRVRGLYGDARPGADLGRVRDVRDAGPFGARIRGHRDHPRLATGGGAALRSGARCAAARARSGNAAGHDLLRGVRAGPHRAAGRPLGHHALGARRAVAAGVPAGAA
jgi:hypothetical protein